jgi:hypothetical protein
MPLLHVAHFLPRRRSAFQTSSAFAILIHHE